MIENLYIKLYYSIKNAIMLHSGGNVLGTY